MGTLYDPLFELEASGVVQHETHFAFEVVLAPKGHLPFHMPAAHSRQTLPGTRRAS